MNSLLVGEIRLSESGKFAHTLDPEDNKIGLWEPEDAEYKKLCPGKTTY